MTWRILWDPANEPEEPRAWLRREDGSVAMVLEDGRVIDVTPADDDREGDRPA